MVDEKIADLPALPVAPPTRLAVLTDTLDPAELASAVRFADAAKAANTRLAYASDWADFCRWAASRGTGVEPDQRVTLQTHPFSQQSIRQGVARLPRLRCGLVEQFDRPP